MAEIDRTSVINELSVILQKKYVALLGQRGIGIDEIINALTKRSSNPGMKFISIALPRTLKKEDEFEELFLERLLGATSRVPPESLSENVLQAVQKRAAYSANSRIRIALDILGKGTSANYLVIILHALAEIAEEPLKNLLLMLREYNDQRENEGEAGEKLRFLVAGEARLWRLCYYKTPERSPYNIAQRIFLDGCSYEELLKLDSCTSLDTAVMLRDLTDGIPLLVEEVLRRGEDTDDLSPYFRYLQDDWNALSQEAQEILKSVVEGSIQNPRCQPDYQCPQIPAIASPWQEAFWGGFLRMRYRQLAWRSPIHQAFVMRCANITDDSSRYTMMRVDLRDRIERLKRALENTYYSRNKREPFEEARSLAYQTCSTELAAILEMAQRGEKSDTIAKKIEQLSSISDREWLKELGKEAIQQKDAVNRLLLEVIITQADRFLTGQFDVFLCHNDEDKDEVKEIGKKLKDKDLLPWLDEWEVPPGRSWLRVLGQQLTQVRAAAVFIGKNGIGPWQLEEIEVLLQEFVKRKCPVIPVLLKSAPEPENLQVPIFLSNKIKKWVNFCEQDPDPLEQLIWGIRERRF